MPDTVVWQRAWDATSLGTYLNDQAAPSLTFFGGRTWWAHLDFTRINTALIILKRKFEETPDLLETGALSGLSYDGPVRAVSEPHAVSTA